MGLLLGLQVAWAHTILELCVKVVMFKDGKVLFSGGKVAMHSNCCCEEGCTCQPTITLAWEPAPTACTGCVRYHEPACSSILKDSPAYEWTSGPNFGSLGVVSLNEEADPCTYEGVLSGSGEWSVYVWTPDGGYCAILIDTYIYDTINATVFVDIGAKTVTVVITLGEDASNGHVIFVGTGSWATTPDDCLEGQLSVLVDNNYTSCNMGWGPGPFNKTFECAVKDGKVRVTW